MLSIVDSVVHSGQCCLKWTVLSIVESQFHQTRFGPAMPALFWRDCHEVFLAGCFQTRSRLYSGKIGSAWVWFGSFFTVVHDFDFLKNKCSGTCTGSDNDIPPIRHF